MLRFLSLLLLATAAVGSSTNEAVEAQQCANEECINNDSVDDDSSCIDNHQNCELWASQGKCEASKKYMDMYCQKSCGICGAGSNSTE